jgi:GNAT superfamily N-acetyltransferase
MIEYRIFSPGEAPADLFSFRYRIYVEEMHRPQRYACAQTKTIEDPLDRCARQVVALQHGRVIACIRANLLREGSIGEYLAFYDLDKLSSEDAFEASICTRLMVDPEHRKTSVSIDIFKRLYAFAIDAGVRTSYMDCNPPLVRFFSKFGYERLGEKRHPEYGHVAIMKLDHFDFVRLVRIGSPFADLARDKAKAMSALLAAQ